MSPVLILTLAPHLWSAMSEWSENLRGLNGYIRQSLTMGLGVLDAIWNWNLWTWSEKSGMVLTQIIQSCASFTDASQCNSKGTHRDISLYLELLTERKVDGCYYQFYNVTLDRQVWHAICVVCTRHLSELEHQFEKWSLTSGKPAFAKF